MSSITDRWFVPDHEYYNSIRDYAVAGYSAREIREHLSENDGAIYDVSDDSPTFITEYNRRSGPSSDGKKRRYEFGVHGRLVYADVDDKDPAHKEKVYGEMAKEAPIEESEKTTEMMKQLVTMLTSLWWSRFFEDDFPEEETKLSREELDHWTLVDLKDLIRQGLLNEPIFSRILTAKTVEEKVEILNIMSGQTSRPTKRPVLSLITIIDSKSNIEVGETEGWVTAYDFIKDLLVIKPFLSKEGKHPLAEKWHGDIAQDEVSFSGTPREFAEAYIELGKTIDAGNKEDGFKMLVHTFAAKWIHHFGADFETAYGTEFHTDLLAIKEAIEKVKKGMEGIKFPNVEKNVQDDDMDLEPFYWTIKIIESEEDAIRASAVGAKERGKEKIAQNAAKLYESIHQQIQAFLENPSMDL